MKYKMSFNESVYPYNFIVDYSYTTDDYSYTTDIKTPSGLYCYRCGAKTFLAADGSHRRCPECDDRSNEWIITCEGK